MSETKPALEVRCVAGLSISQRSLEDFAEEYVNFLPHIPSIESIEELFEITEGFLTIENQEDLDRVILGKDFDKFSGRIRARVRLVDPDNATLRFDCDDFDTLSTHFSEFNILSAMHARTVEVQVKMPGIVKSAKKS